MSWKDPGVLFLAFLALVLWLALEALDGLFPDGEDAPAVVQAIREAKSRILWGAALAGLAVVGAWYFGLASLAAAGVGAGVFVATGGYSVASSLLEWLPAVPEGVVSALEGLGLHGVGGTGGTGAGGGGGSAGEDGCYLRGSTSSSDFEWVCP